MLLGADTLRSRQLRLGPELATCLEDYMDTSPRCEATAPLLARTSGEQLSSDSIRRLLCVCAWRRVLVAGT